MPRTCFVTGCSSGGRVPAKRKRDETSEQNHITLFRAPQKDEELQKWQSAFPRSHGKLEKKHYVCEKHFRIKDVAKNYVHNLVDGSTFLLSRGRAILKPGAIPCKFPSGPISVKRSLTLMDNNNTVSWRTIERQRRAVETNGGVADENVPEKLKKFSYKDFESVKLPSDFWYYKIMNDKVGFACWSKDLLATEKRVVLSIDMSLKVFVMDKEVSIDDLQNIQLTNDMSDILARVQALQPCPGANSTERAAQCLHYYLVPKNMNRSRCLQCKIRRQHLNKLATRSKLVKYQPKAKNLHKQIRSLVPKISQMKAQVTKLKRCMERLKSAD